MADNGRFKLYLDPLSPHQLKKFVNSGSVHALSLKLATLWSQVYVLPLSQCCTPYKVIDAS